MELFLVSGEKENHGRDGRYDEVRVVSLGLKRRPRILLWRRFEV